MRTVQPTKLLLYRKVLEDHSMDNTAPSSDEDTLGSRWQNVREFSFLLSAIGAVITTVLPVLSIGGSGLLLIVITKYSQLRHVPSNLLLASLAVADLLIGLLVLPLHGFACVCVLFGKKCSAISLSNVHFYIGSLLTYSSCLNIVIITIDRYICIVESLRYPAIMTKARAIQAIVISWAISAVLPATRLIPSYPLTAIKVSQIILISAVLSVIIFCYIKISSISRRHKKDICCQMQAVTAKGPIKQDFKSVNTVFLVVGAVIFSYVPLLAVQVCLTFNVMKYQVKILQPFAVTFCLLNSSLNPLIIFFRSRKIHRFLSRLLKRDAET